MREPSGPFIGTEALADGYVTRRGLRSQYNMVYRNVYVRRGEQVTPVARAVGPWLWSGRNGTLAGLSAAAIHGSKWIDPRLPAELNRAEGCAVDGIVIHREQLRHGETCVVRGMPVTTPARTALDLGRQEGMATAVIRLDALANATAVKAAAIESVAENHRGLRGVVQLRRVLELMDGGAESPQETRTRLALVYAGLLKPKTQIVVRDSFGVEFDGAQHWTDPAQRTADIDRAAELGALGWRMVRVSSDLLRYRSGVVVARTCAALEVAGCKWLGEWGLMHAFCDEAWHRPTLGGLKPVRQAEFREQRGVEEGHHVRHAVGTHIQHVQLERQVVVSVAHIHRGGGLSVGGQWDQAHIAGRLRGALLANKRGNRLWTLVPADERRHLPDRLGGEQLHQPVDVISLESSDVARQSVLRVSGIRRREPVVGAGASSLQLRPGALQQAVDGGRAGADRVGHLSGLPLQHVTQHQHRSLPRRQVLQRGDEGQSHRFARSDDVGGITGDVRQWLEPRHLGAFYQLRGRI
jgi:hypothetical protein